MSETDPHEAPGWAAIDAALGRLYPGQAPQHYGTLVKWRFGGPDPLDGISAYRRAEPTPHWHFVGYGLSELYQKEGENPDFSGWGFELTFRAALDPAEDEPPMWALGLMQNVARYVVQSGNVLRDGEWMNTNGPISGEADTRLQALAFVADPELPAIDTPNGRVEFIQIIGLTLDEVEAGKTWRTHGLLGAMAPHMPLWTTDLSRPSLMGRPEVLQAVEVGRARDGSSTGALFLSALGWSVRQRMLRAPATTIRLGAGHVEQLLQALSLRLPFGRELLLKGPEQAVVFAPGKPATAEKDGRLRVTLDTAALEALRAALRPKVGEYRARGLADVVWAVELTQIRDTAGTVLETIG